jgi:hypothetical protein
MFVEQRRGRPDSEIMVSGLWYYVLQITAGGLSYTRAH